MDYEKKYKEALEKARIWQNHLYDTNDKDYANELNYIFPELAESEDEKMIGNIRRIIEQYALSKSAVDVNGELCEKEYIDANNWLKSIKERYTWKPSDEQMQRLSDVVHKAKYKNDISVGGYSAYMPLASLYLDLKKLKA